MQIACVSSHYNLSSLLHPLPHPRPLHPLLAFSPSWSLVSFLPSFIARFVTWAQACAHLPSQWAPSSSSSSSPPTRPPVAAASISPFSFSLSLSPSCPLVVVPLPYIASLRFSPSIDPSLLSLASRIVLRHALSGHRASRSLPPFVTANPTPVLKSCPAHFGQVLLIWAFLFPSPSLTLLW